VKRQAAGTFRKALSPSAGGTADCRVTEARAVQEEKAWGEMEGLPAMVREERNEQASKARSPM
jgi:hypothetical protein